MGGQLLPGALSIAPLWLSPQHPLLLGLRPLRQLLRPLAGGPGAGGPPAATPWPASPPLPGLPRLQLSPPHPAQVRLRRGGKEGVPRSGGPSLGTPSQSPISWDPRARQGEPREADAGSREHRAQDRGPGGSSCAHGLSSGGLTCKWGPHLTTREPQSLGHALKTRSACRGRSEERGWARGVGGGGQREDPRRRF